MLNTSDVRTPLYGHTSQDTAYVVPDYPYGFRLRCKIRYWLETHPRHGMRFVSQTTNPKVTEREVWNKPKASTYVDIAACMYLDSEDHVQWTGVGHYQDADDVLKFVATFPGAVTPTLRAWISAKIVYTQGAIDGKVRFTMNGRDTTTEADIARWRGDLETWQRARDAAEALKAS